MSDALNKAQRRRQELREFTDRYKTERGCLRCGEGDPVLLTFHHRDPQTKSATVARLVAIPATMTRLLREIAKCDVLCVACHHAHHNRVKRT